MDEKTKAYVITELALLNEDPDVIRGWVSIFGLLSFLEENTSTSTSKSLYILDRLTRREHLTPITDNPEYWEEVRPGVWQSTRNPDIFSEDHGVHYYRLPNIKHIYKSKETNSNGNE